MLICTDLKGKKVRMENSVICKSDSKFKSFLVKKDESTMRLESLSVTEGANKHNPALRS